MTNAHWERFVNLFPLNEAFIPELEYELPPKLFPLFFQDGQNGHLTDIDGNEYIDYCLASGAVLLGYKYPEIQKALLENLSKPLLTSLLSTLHIDVAELIQDIIPTAEMMVFGKNGSDVCSAAVRLARMITGKNKIISYGYHGFHDWFKASDPNCLGIPEDDRFRILNLEYNNIEHLRDLFSTNRNEIAAVIIDPYTWELPENNFLQELEDIVHSNNGILILDEIVTGFRTPHGSAQKLFYLKPDLTCLSKSIANGMPLSVLAGKKEIMKDISKIKYSLTFYNETMSMAAAKSCLTIIRDHWVWDDIERKGKRLQEYYQQTSTDLGLSTKLGGLPCRLYLQFSEMNGIPENKLRIFFLQELFKQKIISNGIFFPCYTHTEEDILKTIQAFQNILKRICQVVDSGNIDDLLEVGFRKNGSESIISSENSQQNKPMKLFYSYWKSRLF